MESNNIIPVKYALDGPSGIKSPEEPIINKDIIIGSENTAEHTIKKMNIDNLESVLKAVNTLIDLLDTNTSTLLWSIIGYCLCVPAIVYFVNRRKKNIPKNYPPVQNIQQLHQIHNEPTHSEISQSHESEAIRIYQKMPKSSRLHPLEKLDPNIPSLDLDRSRKSDEQDEQQRKISDCSVFTHNHQTGLLEIDANTKTKAISPNIDNPREFKFSSLPPLKKYLSKREKLEEESKHVPIIEENSS